MDSTDSGIRVPGLAALLYHEFRSPLGLIATAASAAAEASDEESVQRYCQTIARVTERMLRTAGVLLGRDGEVEVFSPLRVVEDVVLDHRLDGTAVQLHREGPVSNLRVNGSRAALEALLVTLLANAGDHGDPSAPVHVRLAPRGDDTIDISVSNRVGGDGHRGLGLGTAVAEDLARSLGGTIERSRSPRDRYVVRLSLPLVRETPLAPVVAEAPAPEHAPRRAHTARGLRVSRSVEGLTVGR